MKEQFDSYFLGEMTAEEKLDFLRRIDMDESLQAEFTAYQNTHALLAFSDTVIDEQESHRGYRRLLYRIKRRGSFRMLLHTAGYAAAIALLVVSVHLYHVWFYHVPETVATETSLFVPAGQRVSMTLQDGTVVWLNAQSRLTYPSVFTGKERRVHVEGEAYFEVAPDSEQPFVVSTGALELTVLGTEFNIYNYPEEAISRVSLVKGRLQVTQPGVNEAGIILQPDEEVTLHEGRLSVGTIPTHDYFLWKEGIYSFDNDTFENILKKLELYYDIDLNVSDPAMLDWRYTVKFRQRDGIDEILRLMQRIHFFQMERDEENNRIFIRK